MNESLVAVNSKQCLAISEVLSTLEIRSGFTKRPFISHPLRHEIRLSMLFYAVAICHQTYNLRSEKFKLFGWDYIEKVFLKLAIRKSELIDVNRLVKADEETIARGLSSAFSDDGNPLNSTLDRIEERVKLIKDLSQYISGNYGGSFTELMKIANGTLINNGLGFYELLAKSGAFADPLRKKSSFLAKLLIDSGLLEIKDRDNYIPIMDYHMQRVLLRLGCIEIKDNQLLESIKKRVHLSSDLHIRKACIAAVKELSLYSGIEAWKMNDIFWSLGRSCCNENLLCIDNHCLKEPCTFQTIILLPDHKNCSFESVCSGFGKEETRLLWEPLVETHFY